MNREEIESKMRTLVADSLALTPEEVQVGSRLRDDLGADSLDLVDMIFAMEQSFGIKMRDGELDFFSRMDFTSPDVVRDGFLTEKAIADLMEWLPALREREDPARVTRQQLFELITVETLCIVMERKLAGGEISPSAPPTS